MITAQRQRRRGRATAVVAVLAAAISLLVGLASPAGAATLTFEGIEPDTQGRLIGTAGGETQRLTAGRFIVTVDGERATGYCIDIHNRAGRGPLDEIDWETSGVSNLEAIKAILVNYTADGDEPAGFPLVGSKADRALAIQAAIWHYSDGFDLTDVEPDGNPNVTPDNVKANYATILEAVDGGHISGGGEPTVSLSITPPDDTEGHVGELVGPFVVNTTASSVTVTTSDGITLHDAEGQPFTGTITDGTELWVSADEAIEGTISASAQAEVKVGRVFYGKHKGRDLQRIVLASPVTVDTSAEASVNFKAGPPPTEPSTTTTSTTTTSTTVHDTTTTTVEDTTTTTAPTTTEDQGDNGGGLPVTGAQTVVLVVVALVLLGIGAAFGIIGRRKRLSDG